MPIQIVKKDYMKWFKHMTDARHDPKLLAVKRKFGLKGFGIYWVTIEAVAEQYAVHGEPELSLDLASWREITGISPQMMQKWARFGDETKLFSASFSEKTLTIRINKIKDIKDNHTRNLQATGQQEVEGEEEIDTEKDKGSKTVPNPASQGSADRLTNRLNRYRFKLTQF